MQAISLHMEIVACADVPLALYRCPIHLGTMKGIAFFQAPESLLNYGKYSYFKSQTLHFTQFYSDIRSTLNIRGTDHPLSQEIGQRIHIATTFSSQQLTPSYSFMKTQGTELYSLLALHPLPPETRVHPGRFQGNSRIQESYYRVYTFFTILHVLQHDHCYITTELVLRTLF